MKKRVLSLALVFALVLMFVPLTASAEGAVDITKSEGVEAIQTAIQGAISSVGESGTVTVTGTKEDVTETLSLTIPPGVTVNWQATYSGYVANRVDEDENTIIGLLIAIDGGGKLDVVLGGKVEFNGNGVDRGWAISVNGGTVEVSGGEVLSTGLGISAGTADCNIVVSSGRVETAANAIAIFGGGTVEVSGGTVSTSLGGINTTILAPYGGNVTISGGTVIASGSLAGKDAPSAVRVENGNVTVSGNATVEATGTGGVGIYHEYGAVTVNGGTVSAAEGGVAIRSYDSITINSGGTVTAAGVESRAIVGNGNSLVTVSGGTVSSSGNNGIAIDANESARVVIDGGTVSVTGNALHAISVPSGTSVEVKNGLVSAFTSSRPAIIASNTSLERNVTISGGVVFSYGRGRFNVNQSDVISMGTAPSITGNGVFIAWDSASARTEYYADTRTDLLSNDDSAFWSLSGRGIANNKNSVVVQIPGVTVTSQDTGGSEIAQPSPPPEPDPEIPPPVVETLPTETVEAAQVTVEVQEAATEAVAEVAAQAAVASGAAVTAVAPPVTVSVEERNTVAMLTMPEDVDTSEITTMAVLNADGTLTPVPTRVDADGNVIVLVSGDVTLVPLSVEANFTDTAGHTEQVQREIERAASLMIVMGRGDGVFDPAAEVTGQEAATMFLRAMGVPVNYDTAVDTASERGLVDTSLDGGAPMTRVATAELIVGALSDVGMKPSMTQEDAAEILSRFTDLGDLTDDEMIAMAICVELGIFLGAGGGIMNPLDTLQRSQMASLAVRLQDVILGM